MNIPILKIFFYEWIRTGGIRKIVQLMISLIVPVVLFMFLSVLPAIIKNDSNSPTNIGTFIIFIVSAIYAIYYIIESDTKIMNGFPSEYIPIKMSDFYLTFLLFTFTISVIVIYGSILLTLILVNNVKLNGMHILSIKNVIKYISPLLIGLPYTVFSGVLFGALLGVIGKKLSDNFSKNIKLYILKIYSIIIFISMFRYFKHIYQLINNSQLDRSLWLFSPIYFSSIVSQFFIYRVPFYMILYSIAFNFILFVLFIFIGNIRITLPINKNISFYMEKKDISIISPLWNLVLKRMTSLFTIIFLIVWFALVIFNRFYFNNALLQGINNILMIFYTFIIMDKMFIKQDEDYRYIWESIPITKEHIIGVFFGFYYIIFFMPIYVYSKLNISTMTISSNLQTPSTLSGYLLQHFSIITFTAIIPFLIFLYPYMWASNPNGKKLLKKNAILNFIFYYFLLSGIIGLSYAYIGSQSLRVFVNKQIFGYGYYVFKTLFYSIFLFALIIHIKAIYLLIKSVLIKK